MLLILFTRVYQTGDVIRMQADLNVSVEIFKDFQTGLVFYYSYDNKPPQGSLSTNDYGIMFTVGYIFGK